MTGPRELFAEAATAAELLKTLRRRRVSVQPLGHGPRKSDVEKWAIGRFLATLSKGDVFDQQFSFWHLT